MLLALLSLPELLMMRLVPISLAVCVKCLRQNLAKEKSNFSKIVCRELGLDKDTYSISIPLGSTINMGGGAITISVLSLATAFTLGIDIDVPTAVLLCIISAVSACGASGIPGGSLLLIPLACSLFGVPSGIAMSTVGVGYIISVVQDSCETAVNSSTDVLFTAIADYSNKRKIKIQKKRRAQRVVRAMKKGAKNEGNNDK